MADGPCEICQQVTQGTCSTCRQVYYCSKEHEHEHKEIHQVSCNPFEIGTSKELGRYLLATRNLKPSDVILSETPLVFGPKPQQIKEGPFPCVGCCRILTDQTCERCPLCLWPVCKLDCPGLKQPNIHGFECTILRLKPANTESKSFYEYFRFDVLIALRALALQNSSLKRWETMLALEAHPEHRGPDTDVYKAIEEKIKIMEDNYLKPLRESEKQCGESILKDTSPHLIHKVYGILDVNATELTEEIEAMVLYPTASLLEHNCVPNTMQTIDEKENFRITFRAALPIKKGEHITSTYTNILWGTSARRDHLKQTKYFTCKCRRCQDPTELGTYFSALRCLGDEENCPCGGTQLPVNPTEEDCVWVCERCKIQLPDKEMMNFVNHLNTEVDRVMSRRSKIAELEGVLSKLLNFLHENHYLNYIIKHSLVQLYGNEGNGEISASLLTMKLKMCQDLIEITRKIDPGNARLSLYMGVLLNEQFIGKFKMITRMHEKEKKVDAGKLQEALNILEENKRVLKYEINTTSGARLFNVVCKNEDQLKSWIESNDLKAYV
ncbi:unnamed protein product [Acanthoscelides obtectus]|uniref:Protein msta n=1 Tax=Acanthoscelides obtectus TaxID=200917 RepID=A0A9P0K1G3_ACAOB|nr:unnamed protein product [Acanthoscelides obtectus]CAK1647242.1 Protein msta, isoform A [Acanthoscelides obtectus]